MTGDFYYTEITKVEPIEGKDRILKAHIGGEIAIVSSSSKVGDRGILFDFETELSPEYCSQNNLFKDSELNKDKTQKGYIEKNCRVRPKNFGGVYTTGFFMPFDSLNYTGVVNIDFNSQHNTVNGKQICKKYVGKIKVAGNPNQTKKKIHFNIPDFLFHDDTAQFFRSTIPNGRFVITRKTHGTSAIVARLKVERESWMRRLPILKNFVKDKFEDIISSRRVIKSVGEDEKNVNSFYKTDVWKRAYEEHFKGKIRDGETFYFEILGFEETGKPIQGSVPLSRAKGFIEDEKYEHALQKYGDTVHYHYNNKPGEYSIQVYRITNVINGTVVDSSWEQMTHRCSEMGLNTVPYVASGFKFDRDMFFSEFVPDYFTTEEALISWSENYSEGESDIPNHIPEGICIRFDIGNKAKIFKIKSNLFRLVENAAKEMGVKDTEEEECTSE